MGFWSKVKKAAKAVGRAVVGAVTHVANLGLEIANRFFGLPGFLFDLIVPWPQKKLRLRIKVLVREDGSPLHPTRDLEKECNEAYDLAAKIFKDSANVKLVSYGSLPRVEIMDELPPTEALNPRCDGGAFKDHYTKAGLFYIANKQYSVTVLIGAGAPVTAFIVLDVQGKRGCSQGPMADYLTVDIAGLLTTSGDDVIQTIPSSTLAHEIGHACGLWHHPQKINLMKKSQRDRTNTLLKRYQKAIFRNSRHVTYL